jgi:hypothetical protein
MKTYDLKKHRALAWINPCCFKPRDAVSGGHRGIDVASAVRRPFLGKQTTSNTSINELGMPLEEAVNFFIVRDGLPLQHATFGQPRHIARCRNEIFQCCF